MLIITLSFDSIRLRLPQIKPIVYAVMTKAVAITSEVSRLTFCRRSRFSFKKTFDELSSSGEVSEKSNSGSGNANLYPELKLPYLMITAKLSPDKEEI